MAANQILLCGTTISFQSGFLGKLIDVSDIGAERRAVEAPHAGADWVEVIYSCLKRLLPFQATIAFDPNADWKSVIEGAPETITITWSIPGGYATAATLQFTGAATRVAVRGATEERMVMTCTITPTGEPTLTPGDTE